MLAYIAKTDFQTKKGQSKERSTFLVYSLAFHFPVTWAQGYKYFSCSNKLSIKYVLHIHVKMQTIVGILTFISWKYSSLGLHVFGPENVEFLDSFLLMSI